MRRLYIYNECVSLLRHFLGSVLAALLFIALLSCSHGGSQGGKQDPSSEGREVGDRNPTIRLGPDGRLLGIDITNPGYESEGYAIYERKMRLTVNVQGRGVWERKVNLITVESNSEGIWLIDFSFGGPLDELYRSVLSLSKLVRSDASILREWYRTPPDERVPLYRQRFDHALPSENRIRLDVDLNYYGVSEDPWQLIIAMSWREKPDAEEDG